MNDFIIQDGELYHYGVLGMKWGVHRATRKSRTNERLRRKALEYDKKSAELTKKAEKAHAKNDLGASNRKAIRAAKYDKKAAKLESRALETHDGLRRSNLERRAETKKYKAAKARIEGNRLSKSAGYGSEAMRYSVKSDKVAKKAAKARMHIAKNKAYVASMNRKVSSLSDEELRGAYSFVNEWLKDT